MTVLGRRILTVGGVWSAAVASVPALVAVLPVACLVDLIGRRRLAACRFALFIALLLWAESIGALVALAIGGDPERNYALQRRWAGALWAGTTWLYGIRLVVTGDPVPPRGPFLLFARHATLADTLLPMVLVARPLGLRPRYVLKRELLWDPCLDIVGNRVPNVFVRREGGRDDGQLRAIEGLAGGMGPGDFAAIYPEGTRFSRGKRAQLAASANAAVRTQAERLTHLLPPRPAGVAALLDGAPTADVVWCAHTGLDAAARLPDFWAGDLIDATIRVHLWHERRGAVPDGYDERLAWLQERWERMDRWIDAPK